MAIFVLNPYILAVLAQRSLQSAGYDGGVVSTTSATYAARMSLATTEDAANYVAFWQSRIYHSAATSDTRAELFETSARQQVNIEVQNTLDRVSVGGAYYYAGGTSKTFQIRSSAEAGTASIADLSLQVLKLETNDTGNVNLTATSTLSTTFATLLTNTIPASGDYYVIGSAELLTDNADAEVNINGVSYGALGDSMGQDATTYSPYFHLVKVLGDTPTAKFNAGDDSSSSINYNNNLFSWGTGVNGVLGDGTTVSKSSPIQIGTSSWTAVKTNSDGDSKVAIRVDGGLFSWGSGANGQLGSGATLSRSSPVQIGTSSWSLVAAGGGNAVAIRYDGSLFTWGLNSSGQLGDGTTVSKSSPVQLSTPIPEEWSYVNTSAGTGIAIKPNGTLFTWGSNSSGQLGDGTTIDKSSPVQIGTSSWSIVDVRNDGTSGNYCVAIRSDGALFAWGGNTWGQLGDGTTVAKSSPIQIGTSSWITVAAGNSHAIAIRSDGAVFAWGSNFWGNIGDGTQITKSSPVQIGTSSWTAVRAGDSISLAIRNDGALFTWGFNQNTGQLGDGTTTDKSSPVKIGSSSWTFVGESCAIRTDGGLFVWGSNGFGQLGDGTSISRSSPVQLGTSSWTQVRSRNNNAGAIRSDGTLFTWGVGNNGRLGDGTTIAKSSPVQIGSNSWKLLTVSNNSGAIRGDNGLFTWGQATVGDGTTISRSSPVIVGIAGFYSWNFATTVGTTVAAIRSDGALFAWGGNAGGQLGIGQTTNRSEPVQIGTSSWTAIALSLSSSSAIRSDGGLFTWGSAAVGQLGDGTTVSKSSPIQIGTSSWISLSGGLYSIAAIRSDSGLFTWGHNSILGGAATGTLGDGTTISKSSPVQIGTSSWVSVDVGGYVMGATSRTGSIFTWGLGSSGQLGDGTTVAKSSPVQVQGSVVPYNAPNSTALLRYRSNDGTTMTIRGASLVSLKADKFPNTYYFQQPTQQSTTSTTPVTLANSAFTVANPGNYHLLIGSAMLTGTTVANRTVAELVEENSGLAYNLSHIREPNATTEYYPTVVARVINFPSANINLAWKAFTTAAAHTAQVKNMAAVLLDTGIPGSQTTFVGTTSATNSANVAVPKGTQAGDVVVVASFSDDTTPSVPGDVNQLSTTGSTAGTVGYGYNVLIAQENTDSWTQITAGAAIRSDGALFTWGSNNNGQLGNGTTISTDSPVKIGSSSWSMVAGQSTRFAIRSDGALFAWGFNNTGRLGDGTSIYASSPVQIGTSSWSMVSFDGPAIRSDGALFTWGSNGSGELGDGTTIDKSSPVQIGTSSWSMVAKNSNVTYAIRSDGALFAWGANIIGYLGDGTTIAKSSPVQIGTSSWSVVGVGSAIRSDGGLFAWGPNDYGEIGNGTTILRSSPVQIGTSSWTALYAGGASSKKLAIRSDGALFAWGWNNGSQLGDGTTVSKSSPVQIGTYSWINVSGDAYYCAAIRSDSTLFAWGSSFLGTNNRPTAVPRAPVTGFIEGFTPATSAGHIAMTFRNIDTANPLFVDPPAVAVGPGTGMPNPPAITVTAPGSTVSRSSPVQVGSANTTLIALGFLDDDLSALECGPPQSFTLVNALDIGAAAAGGTLMAAYRDLETDNTTVDPTAFDGTGTDDWVGATLALTRTTKSSFTPNWVSAYFNTAIIGSDGALFMWGQNISGELGDGTTISKSSPIQIGTSSWSTVDVGGNTTAAIRSDGALFTWGSGASGRLGDGTTISKSSPVQIGTSSWTSVSFDSTNGLAIRSDGALFAWGSGFNGLLGDGTTVDKSSPVQIGTSSWTSVSVGTVNGFAIRSDGALFAWGFNTGGQLGDGTTVAKSSPVQIGTSSWSFVSVRGAIRSDGALFTWGNNTNGRLGDGTTIDKSSPVQIGTSSWISLNTGSSHTAAIRSDGALFMWGRGDKGELGDLSNINNVVLRSSPVQLGTSFWSHVSGVDRHIAAITSDYKLFTWGDNGSGQLGV